MSKGKTRHRKGRDGPSGPPDRGAQAGVPVGRRATKTDGLSQEDRELWQHLSRQVTPLEDAQARVPLGDARIDWPEFDVERTLLQHRHDASAPDGGGRKAGRKETTDRAKSTAPQLAAFNPRAARKLRSGRHDIEARLDLHGMRQHEALAALKSFLWSAHRRGAKWVLVISGHGRRHRAQFRKDRATGSWAGPENVREPGVLRQNVPRWLAEPELRAIVVSFQAAAIRHGGDGAFYVELRSIARRKPLR